MPTEVIFPKVDMDMESGELTEWLCNDGDIVKEGDPIFVIETDKSGMEIESPGHGKIVFAGDYIGQQVKVGHILAYLYSEDDGQVQRHSSIDDSLTSDAVKKLNVEHSETHNIEPVDSNAQNRTEYPDGNRASPAARKLANENGISLSNVVGTARQGRVVKGDVVNYLSNSSNATVPPDTVHAGKVHAGAVQPGSCRHDIGSVVAANHAVELETIPHSSMRRTIASRLVEAVNDIPSYQISIECNCSSLLKLKSEIEAVKTLSKVSINDLFIKALALTLRDHPRVNCAWTDDAMLINNSVDIGIAVALADGLITPLVKNADNLSISQISASTSTLIYKAKNGSLQRTEYQGGSSTISNLGMFGIDEFNSIINPPQGSIVSIGSIKKKPVVNNEGDVIVAPLCKVTFSFDHRLIDGAAGAKFADSFRTYVENAFSLTL